MAKAGHHSDALEVAFADSLESVDIADRSTEWDWGNELGEEYRFSRQVIPIETLLGGRHVIPSGKDERSPRVVRHLARTPRRIIPRSSSRRRTV